MFYIVFDFAMAVVMLLFGIWFIMFILLLIDRHKREY